MVDDIPKVEKLKILTTIVFHVDEKRTCPLMFLAMYHTRNVP